MSTGCVAACPPAELEAVLAHEIAHVRLHDVQVQTAAAVAAAVLLETSRIGGWFERALLFVLGPIAAACVHLLVSPRREFSADRYAAKLCDSPHGLADALLRLEQAAELVEFEGSPASEPMFTINPFAEHGLGARCSSRTRRSRSACAGSASSTPLGTTASRAKRPPSPERKEPLPRLLFSNIIGGDLLSREVALRVPSALAGLTSLFGMGRGVSLPV